MRGEPGVGKSALLEDLVSDAGDALVLRTQGLEVETPLAFAALHRLLLPVMRLRDDLPVPQARALRVAFGEEDGPAVEPFLVAIATLSLLTAAAEESTVLCVVEDAHWLDPATADALLFCARRLGADRVLLLFSARDSATTPFRPDGIDELVLAGLAPDEARALLGQRTGTAPAPEVTERLIAETGGNPLALLELPAELSADQLDGTAPLPTQLHLSTRVEQAFLDRSRLLPTPVQSLLLLAAADDTGELTVVRDAASTLGLDEDGPRGRRRLRPAGLGRRLARGASPAGALGGLPGRHRRAAAARPPGAGRRVGRARRHRPGGVAPRRRGRRSRTPTLPPLSRSSGPAPSVAARTSRRWPPTSARPR